MFKLYIIIISRLTNELFIFFIISSLLYNDKYYIIKCIPYKPSYKVFLNDTLINT